MKPSIGGLRHGRQFVVINTPGSGEKLDGIGPGTVVRGIVGIVSDRHLEAIPLKTAIAVGVVWVRSPLVLLPVLPMLT